MTESQKWERILEAEGMPAEIRPLTSSNNTPGHKDGLVCVSATNKFDNCQSSKDSDNSSSGRGYIKDWIARLNLKSFGVVTTLSDLEVAAHWRQFSKLIWDCGLKGNNLEFLLSYADHGNLLRASREFNITRERGRKLIEFVWLAWSTAATQMERKKC